MSNLLAVKMRGDLRATWSRILLMVLAITISLAVFGAVLLAWSAVGRETSGAYASTEPASATILLEEDLDPETMAAIAAEARRRPQVIDARGRSQFTGEVETAGRVLDIPLQVFVAAPDDPLRIARFFPEQRSWPSAPGEVFVGRDSLTLLGVGIGDTLSVTTENGQRVPLRVADTVYDPSLSPSPQEQTGRAYLSTSSLVPSGQAGLDQLKIQVTEPGHTTATRDRDVAVAVAGDVGTWLQQEHGLTIREIQVPDPYTHPHQWQADTLLLSLLAGGAAALLLSTILVANMLGTLFSQQIPQIGIMKAIGAGSGRIGRFYLMMTLLVAAAATLLALVPAILIGRLGLQMFLGFLGVEPLSTAAPWWAYAVIFVAGLGLPPLMAIIPLVRTSRTTVREAIDHHGGAVRTSGASGVLARLSRVRRLNRGFLMALRNTVRRPSRFWLSVGLLASAGTVFVAGMSLGSGIEAIESQKKEQRTWDVEVQLATPASMDAVAPLVEQFADVSRVEGWNRAQTGVAGPGQIPVTRTYPDQGHGRVSLTAIPPDTTMMPTPTMLEGRWLNPGETGAVVLNQITRNKTVPDVTAGDTIQLLVSGAPSTSRVVGIVEEREGGGGGVYATAEGFADMTGQPAQVNSLRIATDNHDEQTRRAVAATVEKSLTDAGIDVQSAASVSRSDAISGGHLSPVITIVLVISIAMGTVGAIGLGSTMSSNILDRTREFGVMHAIGARPRMVRRIVIAEGAFLAVASCLVAVVPALALTKILGDGLGNLFMDVPLPYMISGLAVAIWVVLVLLGAMLATDAAASRASRITVREALTYL